MTGRKVAAIVFGVIAFAVGVAMISGAYAMLRTDRDVDDFYISEAHPFVQSSYAIVSQDVDVLPGTPSFLADWLADPVDLRVQGASALGEGLFVGIGDSADVERYLSGVAHHEVTSISFDGASIENVEYRLHEGTAAPPTPALEGFWVASTEGAGELTLDWSLESGEWTAVVMNADGLPGINAELALGARISNIVAISWIAMLVGVVLLLGGGLLAYRGLRRAPEMVGPAVAEVPEEVPAPREPAGRK